MTYPLNHEEWQAQVVDLARVLGWQHLHVRRTIGRGKRWTTSTNVVGWPDLFLWHPRYGFLAIELKVGTDKAKPEQLACLESLAHAGAVTAVLYPSDFQRLQALLHAPSMPRVL